VDSRDDNENTPTHSIQESFLEYSIRRLLDVPRPQQVVPDIVAGDRVFVGFPMGSDEEILTEVCLGTCYGWCLSGRSE
jgi:hypothetical protein